MEPQDNGYPKPNLSSGKQNPVAWWQSSDQTPTPSIDNGKPDPINQSMKLNNDSSAQSGIIHPVPLQANNSDLVEEEWVNAAKRIMDTYKSDPYNKNRSLTYLRADYLKKRYNKDVKIPEN
jgi:hypothetical protein